MSAIIGLNLNQQGIVRPPLEEVLLIANKATWSYLPAPKDSGFEGDIRKIYDQDKNIGRFRFLGKVPSGQETLVLYRGEWIFGLSFSHLISRNGDCNAKELRLDRYFEDRFEKDVPQTKGQLYQLFDRLTEGFERRLKQIPEETIVSDLRFSLGIHEN